MQVQAEQEQEKDDPDVADRLDQGGFGDQCETERTGQPTEHDVGDQQRLASEQGDRREHRGAGEDQEHGEDDRPGGHGTPNSTCKWVAMQCGRVSVL